MNDQLMLCDDRKLTAMLAAKDDSQQEELLAHIGQCQHCQTRLRELAADDGDWRTASEAVAAASGGASFFQRQDTPATWNESMVTQLLSPPTHPEMLGRLGRYEIERLIGSGGMGIVFKAFDTELNRPAAVKILAPYLASSGPARKRFAREARAAAGIVDDHVVPIFNVESEGEPPFLVMQYVAGGSLQDRLDRDGPLEVAEVLRIGLQTAKGLAAAHAQGLIHRDVKPSNILLDEGVERALLTDFSLARAEHEVSLTHTGFHPGTPDYMSPEQVRGESIDARSDLFSLGCLLYALCTGHPPFRADSSYAVLRNITDDKPQSIRECNPQLPDWLDRLVMTLLAKSPDDRYSSATQVAELLESCLAHVNQPVEVPLPKGLYSGNSRQLRFSRLRKVLTFAGIAGVTAVLAMALLFNDEQNSNGDDATASQNQDEPDSSEPVSTPVAEKQPQGKKASGNEAARLEFTELAKPFEHQGFILPANMVPGNTVPTNMLPANMVPARTSPANKSGAAASGSILPAEIDPGEAILDDHAVHVEALLLFEESHRGSHLGLMALRTLLIYSSRNLRLEEKSSPRERVLKRLVHYADRPILSEVLSHAIMLNSNRKTEQSLRTIINAPNVSKYVRPSAQLSLAKWMLQFEPYVKGTELSKLREKHEPQASDTQSQIVSMTRNSMTIKANVTERLAAAPDPETFGKWKKEAIAILESLRETATDIRPPGIKASGSRNFVRISHELTKQNPTLSELADRALIRRANELKNLKK